MNKNNTYVEFIVNINNQWKRPSYLLSTDVVPIEEERRGEKRKQLTFHLLCKTVFVDLTLSLSDSHYYLFGIQFTEF